MARAFDPFKFQQIKYFHTGVFANLAASLMKKFVPSRIYSKIQIGCQFPGGGLHSFYAVPTKEAASQRFLARIRQCLKTRFEHEQAFQLGPALDPVVEEETGRAVVLPNGD